MYKSKYENIAYLKYIYKQYSSKLWKKKNSSIIKMKQDINSTI